MAGPFDRALGPEHVEGLPGKVVFFYIVPLVPVLKGGACGAHAGQQANGI